jgi:SAM-dependent methyltransferase
MAASLTGPDGSVTGIDHSPDALAQARLRAGQRGLAQVQFIEGDMHDPAPGGPYDAVIEQLALWLDPDPVHVLRQQVMVLRPDGLVVAIEADTSTWKSLPESASWTQAMNWRNEAFARAGMKLGGLRLWDWAAEAGLRRLGMIGVQPYWGPGDEDALTYLVESMRVAAPLIVGTGVATAEEIGMETIEQRLRDEWEKTQAAFHAHTIMGLWATTAPE